MRDELATKGKVLLDGDDVARLRRREVPTSGVAVGIVFQDFKLLPRKTVRENVAFALEVTGTPRQRIGPAVDRVLRARRPFGPGRPAAERAVRRRAAADRHRSGAVHDPHLFIADEPTGNLDPLISWEIIQLLLRINEMGVTVLMATHNAEVVTALRKRVVGLEDGRVVRDETGGAYNRRTRCWPSSHSASSAPGRASGATR